MSEQDLVKAAHECVAGYNVGDWERQKAELAEDVVYSEAGTGRRFEGIESVIEVFQGWKQALPDSRGEITRTLVCGDSVVIELTWKGTQTGPLIGPSGTIPPSGRAITVPAALVLTFQEGRIKEFHQYFDLLTLLRQIGAVPEPASS